MNVKLGQIKSSQLSLTKLSYVKLPVKVSYWISRVINKISSEMKLYEEKRMDIIKSLGEQTDIKTDSWTVKNENLTEFKKQIEELDDTEIDLGVNKIKIAEIGIAEIEPELLPEWLFEE